MIKYRPQRRFFRMLGSSVAHMKLNPLDNTQLSDIIKNYRAREDDIGIKEPNSYLNLQIQTMFLQD
jgi:hypothetical protein